MDNYGFVYCMTKLDCMCKIPQAVSALHFRIDYYHFHVSVSAFIDTSIFLMCSYVIVHTPVVNAYIPCYSECRWTTGNV